MPWRYRKSIKLLPGVKLNLNGKSTSITFGDKGFHTTINTNGVVTESFGIKGTGLSYRNSYKIGSKNNTVNGNAAGKTAPIKSYNRAQKADIDHTIRSLYSKNIGRLDWVGILRKPINGDSPAFLVEIKAITPRVLSGDADAYIKAFELLNPFNEVLKHGGKIESVVIDSNTISVFFSDEGRTLIKEMSTIGKEESNKILKELFCGIALSIARDVFYLLPVDTVYFDGECKGVDSISVCFRVKEFASIDLENCIASDVIGKFCHRMNWSKEKGFEPIVFLDQHLMNR